MADRISFTQYQPPGVYTQSILTNEQVNLTQGARIPLVLGPASPLIENVNVPVVRGSNKNFPVFVEREDLSSQANGTNTTFVTKLGPFIDPYTGALTTNPENIVVLVDDQSVTPTSLISENSEGKGVINFPFAPDAGAVVLVSYHYIVRDKSASLEDLSNQVDGSATTFYTKHRRVVDGSDTGAVSNDPVDIQVLVNNVTVSAQTLNGEMGQFTLASAPANGAVLSVTYKYSDHIDLNDPLPNKYVHSISRVGNVPSRADYINGIDYNFTSEATVDDTTFHEIAWGNSFVISTMLQEDNTFSYDWVPGENLHLNVFDQKIFGEALQPVDLVNGVTKVFQTKWPIVKGDGKGKHLFDASVDSSTFGIYFGETTDAALPGGSTNDGNIEVLGAPVYAVRVEGDTGKVYLDTAVDPSTINVYAVYHTNFMVDESYTMTKVSESDGVAPSTYKLQSPNTGFVPAVTEGNHSLTAPLQTTILGDELYWSQESLLGTSLRYQDVSVNRSHSQDEVVKITIDSLLGGNTYQFSVTSTVTGTTDAGLTGSDTALNTNLAGMLRSGLNNNQGISGEPYVDTTTGFSFNFRFPAGLQVGDYFEFNISAEGEFDFFSTDLGLDPLYNNMLPGLILLSEERSSFNQLSVGQSVGLRSYRAQGAEPEVGDTYYVTYKYYRIDFRTKLYTRFSDVEAAFGLANLSNPLSLAGKIHFDNDVAAVAIKPLTLYTDQSFQDYLKSGQFGVNIDPVTEANLYLDAIKELEEPFEDNRTPYSMVALTDDTTVWSGLKKHVEKMSSTFFNSERYSVFGFAPNRKDNFVRSRVLNFKSNRTMVTYPTSVVMDVETERGRFDTVRAPGWYYACAISGLISRPFSSPSDPLTNLSVGGFRETGIFRNQLQLNELAQEGVTILETRSPNMVIRDALNTDMTSVLTREPTVTFIADFVEQQARVILNRFIGRKFINTILGEIESVFSAYLSELKLSELITDFRNVEVFQNENDPTIVEVSAEYAPVLPVKYILVTFRIRGTLG